MRTVLTIVCILFLSMCLFARKAGDMNQLGPVKNILCYGDSLTAGYYRYGSEFHPYGDTLANLSSLPVTSIGMSGWTTDQMVDLAENEHNEDFVGNTGGGLKALVKGTHFDLVILMAGTNDLGTGVSVSTVIENIEVLVRMCLNSSTNTRVALLSVPPTGGEVYYESVRKRRAAANQGIANIASRHSHRVIFIDTSTALPNPGADPDPPSQDSALWDSDTLHFSPYGSQRLGEFVYNELVQRGVVKV